MTTKHKCAGKIWGAYRDVSGRVYPCARPATVERDGVWYCWQHDPEWVKADKKKRRAAENAKADRQSAMWRRRARNARLAELVTPELLALIERTGHYAEVADAEEARTLAARIREALD